MKGISRAAVVATLMVALALLASPSPALAQKAPVNELLSLMIVSDMLADRCPDAYRPRYSDAEFDRFQSNFDELEAWLSDLAIMLDPALGRDAATREILQIIDRRRGKFASNLDSLGCSQERVSPYVERFAFFAAADFRERFKNDVFPGFPFDQKRPVLPSSAGATSYAYDEMRQTAIGIIQTEQYSVEPCPDFDILEISVVSREEVETDNLPVFIAGPIHYSELWRVRCNGKESAHRVGFSQTSQGGSEAYFVE